jgi:periplasmic divalent cation tolerance protein
MEEGHRLARLLVSERLAACVNLLPHVTSWYWWEGKVERGLECLLLIKTRRRCLRALHHTLRTHHSYQVPELIVLPIHAGDSAYLDWLHSSLR